MDYSTGTELWKYQWDFIHNPEGGWHIFEEVEEAALITDESEILEILDEIKVGYENGEDEVSFNYGTENLYNSSVDIGGDEPIKMQINLDHYQQETRINPANGEPYAEEYIYQQSGNYTALCFEGIGSSGTHVVEIIVEEDKYGLLTNYLYPYQTFETDSISQEVEEVIDEIESDSILDVLATCNLCVRRAFRRIALTDVLYPIHLNDYNGKISAIGKANDIYCDFIRWFHNDSYLSIKQNYVDPLIEDNIQIAQEFDSAGYANTTIEDFRSDIEITEFESIEKNLIVEHEDTQYNIPDYNSLQDLADQGALIMGVRKKDSQNSEGHYSSGHVVVLLPFDESSDDEEGRGNMSTISDITIYYPYSMECGGDYKSEGWLGTESFLNMKWYIYK